MAHRITPDPDEVAHRFLADRRRDDRRSRGERRRGDRRVVNMPVAFERRSGLDRRSGRDRRVLKDRRLPSAAQFSWDETRVIQKMLVHPKTDVTCPRCRGSLLLGPLEYHGGVSTREVHCTGCRNSVVIVD